MTGESKEPGNANKEEEAKIPQGDFSEKWPNLCDPDQDLMVDVQLKGSSSFVWPWHAIVFCTLRGV